MDLQVNDLKTTFDVETLNWNMKKFIFTGILSCIAVFCISQTTNDSCNLKVCVVNNSLYQIDRIVINNTLTIDSLAPNEKSDFICSKSLFETFKSDVTFTRKKLFGGISKIRLISYPIDHVGEKEFKEGRLELLLTIDKEGKNKNKIHFDITQVTTD